MNVNVYEINYQNIQRQGPTGIQWAPQKWDPDTGEPLPRVPVTGMPKEGDIIFRGLTYTTYIGAADINSAVALIPAPASGENLILGSSEIIANLLVSDKPSVAAEPEPSVAAEPPKVVVPAGTAK